MRRNHILRTSVALAAVTALLGACSESSADTDDKADERPSSSSPTATEETSTAAEQIALPDGVLPLPEPDDGDDFVILDAGRYQVPLSDTLALEIDLPPDTEANADGLYLVSEGSILKVEAAGEKYGVPGDPCSAQYIAAVGATVDDLVEAIRNQPILQVSRPEPTEIGGVAGTYLEVRVPAGYDSLDCEGSQVGLPGNPGTNNNMEPGYVGEWWILDVDGQRAVVQTFCDQCDAEASERATKMVQSITFTPTP